MRTALIAALSRLRSERGAAAVEFALVLPILVVLLFGVIDLGRAFNYDSDLTRLANQGARFAAVNSTPGGNLHTYLKDDADSGELKGLMASWTGASSSSGVCIAFPTNSDTGTSGKIGDPVQVKTYAKFTFMNLPLGISNGAVDLVGSATMRLEQKPTKYTADVTNGKCP